MTVGPINCPHCNANLALVGKVHRCRVPVVAHGGHTKITYTWNAKNEIIEIQNPVGALITEHGGIIASVDVINSDIARQKKWRAANPDLNRARAREGMRKKRQSEREATR